MQSELMQQQQQQQCVIPEAVMGLASWRDRDQNMYSDMNEGGKSKCVCEVSRFSSTSIWPVFSWTSDRAAANAASSAPPNTLNLPTSVLLHTIHGLNACFWMRLIASLCYCGSHINSFENVLRPQLNVKFTWMCLCVAASLSAWQAVCGSTGKLVISLRTSYFRKCVWVLSEHCQLVFEISQPLWAHKVSNNQQGLEAHKLL